MYVVNVCHKDNYVERDYGNVADGMATVADMCHLILLVIVVGCDGWNSHCD